MLKKVKTYLQSLSWLSVLVLVILISPAFFRVQKVTVTTQEELVIEKTNFPTVIPAKAVALKEIESFSDKNLKEKKETIKEKTQLEIVSLEKSGGTAIFELADGTYISANGNAVGSDVILAEEELSTTVYLEDDVKILYSPFTTFSPEVYQEVSGGQTLETRKIAKTQWGTYYEVSFDGGRTGWLPADSVSLENPKFTELQTVLTKKYGSNKDVSITVKELDSNLTSSVNPVKKMYAASLWKIPILYWTQKELNAGEANLSDQLKYVSDVNDDAWYAFQPTGTGSLPKKANNKKYKLSELIHKTAKESDNVASNLLAYYETDKFSEDFQSEINEVAGAEWSAKSREANSTMVANVLEALYHEGGAGFNALIDTSYDESRITAGVPSNVRVAHKIGITDEENHDAAIVFADRPYVLVVMTTGEQSDNLITDISKTVYGVLK